jgi:[ribosomal protein S5]-alanine N-acetyltransferase
MLEVKLNPFPELETERLQLKRITADHLTDIFEMRSDPVAMKYIGKPLAKSLDDARDFLAIVDATLSSNDGIAWGIFYRDEKELIGSVSFHRIEKKHYRAEIGYMLKPSEFRKKIMSEIMPEVIDFGFSKLSLHSIEAIISPENKASERLLQKFDFIKEAHFRENFFYEGKFLDSAVYSLLNNN